MPEFNEYFIDEFNKPKYDPESRESLFNFAKKLEGKTLREACHPDMLTSKNKKKGKGDWGVNLEKYYFGYNQNSSHEPDFEKLGIEIKSSGIINSKIATSKGVKKNKNLHRWVGKERISIAALNFDDIINKSFEEVVWDKIKDPLFVLHQYLKDESIFDFPVVKVSFYKYTPFEIQSIYSDWLHIREVVKNGKAHELTGSGPVNLFLEPSTTGGGHGYQTTYLNGLEAKPRRYAFSPSYASHIVKRILEEHSQIKINNFII